MMADRNGEKQGSPEQDYQPDPWLREGRAGRGWYWILASVMAVTVALTFFAITGGQSHGPLGGHAIRTTTGSGDRAPVLAHPFAHSNASAPPARQHANGG